LNVDEFLTPDAVVLYPSRGRILLIGLGAAAFVALSFFLWQIGGVRNQIVAVAACGFFGICFLFALYKLIWRQPALIINSSWPHG
jgi:hypothetical protein